MKGLFPCYLFQVHPPLPAHMAGITCVDMVDHDQRDRAGLDWIGDPKRTYLQTYKAEN